MEAKRGAPEKPPEERKGNVVQIRLTDDDKAACEQAAALDGIKMSQWARDTLLRSAKRRLKKDG